MPASLLLCAVRAVLKFTQDESQVFQNQVLLFGDFSISAAYSLAKLNVGNKVHLRGLRLEWVTIEF